MNKKTKDLVRGKFGGKCAFCASDVSKFMIIWDIEPIQTVITPEGRFVKKNEELENLLPACRSCGSTRTKNGGKKMSIEEFRSDIAASFWFLSYGGITKTSYGKSLRFGLIRETGKDVKFLFEELSEKQQPNS